MSFPFLFQDDVNVYRSSPPLPGIYCPFFLLPSAHEPPLPDSEDTSRIEGFDSDDESDNAEAGKAAAEEESGEQSPSLSESVVSKHPKGTRLTTRKRRASSQPGDSRLVILFLQSTTFYVFIELLFSICFAFLSPADKVPRTSSSGMMLGWDQRPLPL